MRILKKYLKMMITAVICFVTCFLPKKKTETDVTAEPAKGLAVSVGKDVVPDTGNGLRRKGDKPPVLSTVEADGDGTDLAVSTYAHARAPDTCARGDDIMHISFFKIAVWILPEKRDSKIAGKKLSVMGMPAQIQIRACFCSLFQSAGLMVYKNNRFFLIQSFCKLSRRQTFLSGLL